jgi:hypothetical protein
MSELAKHSPSMSRAERQDLSRVVRLRAKIVRSELETQADRILAEFEQQLAAKYSKSHELWADIVKDAEQVAAKADAEIARKCREKGLVEAFRPRLNAEWYSRGENADKNRRDELRRVAETEVEAQLGIAKDKVNRAEADLLTRIMADGLTSATATNFLETMPSIDDLMPKLTLVNLEKKLPLLPSSLDD